VASSFLPYVEIPIFLAVQVVQFVADFDTWYITFTMLGEYSPVPVFSTIFAMSLNYLVAPAFLSKGFRFIGFYRAVNHRLGIIQKKGEKADVA